MCDRLLRLCSISYCSEVLGAHYLLYLCILHCSDVVSGVFEIKRQSSHMNEIEVIDYKRAKKIERYRKSIVIFLRDSCPLINGTSHYEIKVALSKI